MIVIEERASSAARIFIWLLCGGFAGYMVATFVLAAVQGKTISGWPYAVVMVAFVVGFGYRLSMLSFAVTADEVLIHNFFGNHRISRADILGFNIGKTRSGWGPTVLVETVAGVVPISVYREGWPLSKDARAQLADRKERLASWLAQQR